jgi:hypothetical protein
MNSALLSLGTWGIWTCTGAEVVVAAAELAASLLMSDQLPKLPGSASRTSAQWSLGVAVATEADGLHPPRVPAAQAEHASHLCACS